MDEFNSSLIESFAESAVLLPMILAFENESSLLIIDVCNLCSSFVDYDASIILRPLSDLTNFGVSSFIFSSSLGEG